MTPSVMMSLAHGQDQPVFVSVQGLVLAMDHLLLLGGRSPDLDLVQFCGLGETPNLYVLALPSWGGRDTGAVHKKSCSCIPRLYIAVF